jgi:ELWxxDGT repeat protein
VTDGTAAGTALLHDIRPGAALGSSPTNFVAQNSRVFFSAFEDVHGRELWTSDLTTAGTVLLHDLAPQRPNGAGITQLAALGDKVVFDANDGVTGLEPWVSDGTAAGTLQLGDLAAGAAGSAPRGFTSFLGKLYFSANGAAGRELWSTDGTPAGTVQVKDIAPGATGSDPRHFVTWHGALYFTAVTSPFTRTLWRTDGTAAGTVQVSAVAIVDFAPAPLIPLTNCLVIVGTGTLYRYDGSNPAVPVDSVNPVQVNYNAPTLAIGDWGYFFGDRGGLLELWRTDGTAAGTTHVYQFSTYVLQFIGGNYSLAALGDRVVVSANDKAPTGVGQELYVTDGTTAGTSLLRDISPGPASDSDPAALLSVPDRVFFTASDGVHGRELWSTDGTTAGTVLVADLSPGADGALASSTTVAAGVGRRAVIAASTPATGSELWITDGTAGGTQLLFELQPGPASGIAGSVLGGILPLLAQAGANVFFVGNDPNAGPELHVMPAALLEAAEAERIGQGCSGSPGTPAIGYAGVPALGDGTFALTVAGALAVTPAILAAADTRTDVPLPGGCTVYPTLPPITLGTLTSPLGVGAIGVPVPPTPALVGATLFFQWAVLDPNGAFANLLAFSDGLRIRVGKS